MVNWRQTLHYDARIEILSESGEVVIAGDAHLWKLKIGERERWGGSMLIDRAIDGGEYKLRLEVVEGTVFVSTSGGEPGHADHSLSLSILGLGDAPF